MTVASDNTEQQELTLVDILTEVSPAVEPVLVNLSSVTKTTVTSTNIVQTSSNEVSTIAESQNLRLIREQAEIQLPELQGQKVLCFFEDKFREVFQISYIAETQWGNIQVAGFVSTGGDVHIIYLPSLVDGALETTSATCERRNLKKVSGRGL